MKWIPVADQEPPEHENVLGAVYTVTERGPCHYVEIVARIGHSWDIHGNFDWAPKWDEVTHWMPLPELPDQE